MRTIARGGWLAGLGFLVAACSPADEFPCDADAQCLDHGIAGMCQEPGWCSFPDDACPSGQRFGDHAGDGLARTCVPEGGTSTDGPSTTATGATLDTTDPSTVSLSTTSPVTVGEETADEVTSLTGAEATSVSSTDPDPTTTETSTTDPTGNEETTGAPDPCPTYVDDFEDGVIGEEWSISYPDYVHDVDGARIFEITAEDDDIYPATRLTAGQDLTEGWIRAQVGAHPVAYPEHLFLELTPLNSPNDSMLWFIEGDLLIARWDYEGPGWEEVLVESFDPQAHRWLQVRLQDDVFHFEVADEAMSFEPLAMHPAPFDVTDVRVGMYAGNYDPLAAPVVLSWTHFEVCAPP